MHIMITHAFILLNITGMVRLACRRSLRCVKAGAGVCGSDPQRQGAREGAMAREIEGTTIFEGGQALKGYQLNKMCFSFNDPENRKAFLADQAAYMDKYKLTKEQRDALATGSVLKMIEAGGNAYYLAKLAGILGLSVQDIGAQQTGMSKAEFQAKLLAARG